MDRSRPLTAAAAVVSAVLFGVAVKAQPAPQPAFEAACAAELQRDQGESNQGLPDGGYRRNYWRGQFPLWMKEDPETLKRWTRQRISYGVPAVEACGAKFVLQARGIALVNAPVRPTALRPTKALEAHNPANDATKCLEPIAFRDFKRRHVSGIMGASFRNSCPFPVEAQWCIGEGACSRGYGNIATMPAKGDRGFSFDVKANTIATVHWAACRKGFGYRPDFRGTLQYVCK